MSHIADEQAQIFARSIFSRLFQPDCYSYLIKNYGEIDKVLGGGSEFDAVEVAPK